LFFIQELDLPSDHYQLGDYLSASVRPLNPKFGKGDGVGMALHRYSILRKNGLPVTAKKSGKIRVRVSDFVYELSRSQLEALAPLIPTILSEIKKSPIPDPANYTYPLKKRAVQD